MRWSWSLRQEKGCLMKNNSVRGTFLSGHCNRHVCGGRWSGMKGKKVIYDASNKLRYDVWEVQLSKVPRLIVLRPCHQIHTRSCIRIIILLFVTMSCNQKGYEIVYVIYFSCRFPFFFMLIEEPQVMQHTQWQET